MKSIHAAIAGTCFLTVLVANSASAQELHVTQAVALKAAKLCKNRLNRPDEADELFRISCGAGNPEACRETGGKPTSKAPLKEKHGSGNRVLSTSRSNH